MLKNEGKYLKYQKGNETALSSRSGEVIETSCLVKGWTRERKSSKNQTRGFNKRGARATAKNTTRKRSGCKRKKRKISDLFRIRSFQQLILMLDEVQRLFQIPLAFLYEN